MRLSNEFFDRFHKRHPHQIRFESLREELDPTERKALENGETLNSRNGHTMKMVSRSVRPWINWRKELEAFAPDVAEQILDEHPPTKIDFIKID